MTTEPSTTEHELLVSLVDEGRRREGRLAEAARRATGGNDGAGEALEEIRAEAHALKGAAAVVGAPRLFELGKALENLVMDAIAGGSLSLRRAEAIERAAHAFVEGAEASATGEPEPASVAASMDDLAA
jgi:HPt (histidine-containing phosphotransfer) domain-containing protein